MNKKIVILILVILISFCFLSIAVADNATHNDDHTDHGKTIDKNKTPDKNKTDNKTKHYILAEGNGNNIKFSDGFRGFILDYSKSAASSGDEFKRASTSKASNSNTLKLVIIECYKQNATGQMEKIMEDFVKTGSSNTPVGKAVAASHEKVGDHAVVKIDSKTEAVFDFEVLKSVSGNESNYFAYKVSFRTIDNEKVVNQTNNITNITNATNMTNITQPLDNETNSTFLKYLYDLLVFLANALYDAWKPIIDTILNYVLMIVNAIEELVKLFENIMMEIQALMDALDQLLKMLESIWKELDGLLKLFGIILSAIQQLFNLIDYLLNFLSGLISAVISLIQQLLGLLYSVINFILDLINQIEALIHSVLDFLKSIGSYMIKVIENAAIIIVSFVVITFGAFIYNRRK